MSDTLCRNAAFEATIAAPHVVLIRIISQPMGAFTVAGRQELTQFLKALPHYDIRCAILTGQGKAFSVGSNIKEFEATADWIEKARIAETTLNDTIERAPVPVIAACNGYTLGGGAVTALACDFRIAARSATFGLPEVKIGAMATASGTQRLPHLIGRGHALRLMLTGEPVNAEEACRLGIFEEVVEDDALETRAIELATLIAARSPQAIAATRRCVGIGLREGYAAGIYQEEEITVPLGLSDDAIEGKAAFVEKRQPVFKGR